MDLVEFIKSGGLLAWSAGGTADTMSLAAQVATLEVPQFQIRKRKRIVIGSDLGFSGSRNSGDKGVDQSEFDRYMIRRLGEMNIQFIEDGERLDPLATLVWAASSQAVSIVLLHPFAERLRCSTNVKDGLVRQPIFSQTMSENVGGRIRLVINGQSDCAREP